MTINEGDVVFQLQGVITGIHGIPRERVGRRARLFGQKSRSDDRPYVDAVRLTIQTEDEDQLLEYEVPLERARELAIGQTVNLEIRMGARAR